MIFLAFLINIFSLSFIIWVIIKELRTKDGLVLYYCFIASYIVLIPLAYDSVSFLLIGPDETIKNLNEHKSLTMPMDYKFLTIDIIFYTSLYVFYYNVLLIFSYKLIIRKKSMTYTVPKSGDLFPYIIYFGIAVITIYIFYYYYGIDIQRMGFGYRGQALNERNKVLSMILNFGIVSLPSIIVKCFIDKKYLLLLFIISPVIIIGLLTVSRALIIGIPLIIIYYIIVSNRGKILKTLVTVLIIGLLFILALIGIRGNIGFYPLSRDLSVYDLYYGIANRNAMNISSGYYFLNMVKTGTFIPRSDNFVTLETMLWNYRIGYSTTASLHPTLFGWTYIDSGWAGILTAVYFGLFMGITDYTRRQLPTQLGYLFLPFQMVFIAILIRGSVQYAYANTIYILLLFIICMVIWGFRKYFFVFKQDNKIIQKSF